MAAVLIVDSAESRFERAARMIGDAPARAKEVAVARPTPREAPVIRTLWFLWVVVWFWMGG